MRSMGRDSLGFDSCRQADSGADQNEFSRKECYTSSLLSIE